MKDEHKTKKQLSTDQVRVEEEALRESDRRYRLLAENVTDVIWTMDMDLQFTYISPSVTDMLGYSVEEAMAQTLEDVLTPASLEVARKTLAEALVAVEPEDLLELELNRKDGSTVWTEAKMALLRDPDGRPVEILGVARNITERKRAKEALRKVHDELGIRVQERTAELTKANEELRIEIAERVRAEEALRESEKRYRLLAENVTDLIWTTDMNLQFTYITPSVARMLGYSVEEALAKTLEEVLTPASFEVAVNAFAEEMAVEDLEQKELSRSRTLELETYCKDSSTLWTEIKATGLRDPDGRPVGILGVTRDITERKQAEEALRRRAEEMVALVEMNRAITEDIDLKETLDRILSNAQKIIPVSDCSVTLVDESSEDLVVEASTNGEIGLRISPAAPSAVGWVVKTKQILAEEDVSSNPIFSQQLVQRYGFKSGLAVPIIYKDKVIGTLSFGNRHVRRAFSDSEKMMAQAFANQAAIAIENARLYEGIQQKAEELGLLLDTVTTVSSTLELDRVLRTLADKMTTSVRATFCRIALLDEMNQTLTIRAAFAVHGLDWDPGLGRQYAVADAPWHRQAIETSEVIVLRQDDPSQAASETECRMALREGVQSALLIPLVIRDRVLGVVSLGEMRTWERLPFTADRVRLCQAMANQTAVAVRNAQLLDAVAKHRRDLQELSTQLINAQEAERRRISRELHDEMGQALTMMRISLVKIEEELPPQVTATLKKRLGEASSLAEQTLERVRELSLDLRPTMLDDFGLVSALRWYLDRYAKRLNIEVAFEAIDLEDRLPAEMETALYRVVQEALTNVARHAQANKVHLRVERKEASVAALIEDDGRGFEVEKIVDSQAPERGIGLLGIRERVTTLGGNFDIQSAPGEGTRLTVEIPV